MLLIEAAHYKCWYMWQGTINSYLSSTLQHLKEQSSNESETWEGRTWHCTDYTSLISLLSLGSFQLSQIIQSVHGICTGKNWDLIRALDFFTMTLFVDSGTWQTQVINCQLWVTLYGEINKFDHFKKALSLQMSVVYKFILLKVWRI